MSALSNSARHPEPLFEPVPPELLAEPLEYIFADHFRQRVLCAELRRFAATGRVPAATAREMSDFMRHDRVLHHQDEELDLFPALRRRVQPEDNLGVVLERLSEDHGASEPNAADIARALSAPAVQGVVVLSERVQKKMAAMAASEHRHLAVENGLVMTIARVRLTRTDLARMAENMRARRADAWKS